MTNEEIKSECELLYEQIKIAQTRLAELRKTCKHEKTFQGNYSSRPGSYYLMNICEYCNTPIGDAISPSMF